MSAEWYAVSFWGNENVLKLILVAVAQLFKYIWKIIDCALNGWSFISYEFYFNKTVREKRQTLQLDHFARSRWKLVQGWPFRGTFLLLWVPEGKESVLSSISVLKLFENKPMLVISTNSLCPVIPPSPDLLFNYL